MSLRIGIGGIGGRMGREIAAAAQTDLAFALVGGAVRPETAAAVRPTYGPEIRIVESVEELLPEIDVLIDFTTASATVEHARAGARAGTPIVCGATGLSGEQLAALERGGTDGVDLLCPEHESRDRHDCGCSPDPCACARRL